jgi:dolichyl-phosphate-mannose-protein mannosyltransferase
VGALTRNRGLLAILAGGLIVRLAVTPLGNFEVDLDQLGRWAIVLANHGPAEFYRRTHADHLPGGLWILWLVGRAFLFTSPHGEVGAPSLVLMLKLVPILTDAATVLLLYSLVGRVADERAGLVAAGLYAFNPAPIFLSSIWGQWDALSAAFALLAVWLWQRDREQWALPVLTYAALIKPQIAAIAVPLAVVFVKRRAGPRPWRSIALGALLSLGLTVAITVPFRAPPWPAHHDLADQVRFAAAKFKAPSVSGFNLWSFWHGHDDDRVSLALGISYRQWGAALFAGTLLLACIRLARAPDDRGLIWACCVTTLATFVLLTRMHERYLLPALVFAVALAGVERRHLVIAGLLSLSQLSNLLWVFDRHHAVPPIPLLTGSAARPAFALVNLASLAVLLALGPSPPPIRDAIRTHVRRTRRAPQPA